MLIVAGILICIGASLFAFWQTKGPQVVAAIQEAILVRAGQVLNGRLAAESLDFSLSGTTTAHKLVVYDNQNNVIVSCDKVAFDFGVADLFRGNFAPEKIKRVTVDSARVNLSHDAGGRWNTDDLLKPAPDEDFFRFRGELKVSGGSVSVSGPEGENQLEQIEGALDFASYSDIKTALTGKSGDSSLVAEGRWSTSGAMKMNLQADRMKILQMMTFFPSVEKTMLQSGHVYDLTVILRREKGPVEVEANGFVSDMSADFSGAKFTDMQGKVLFAGNILEIEDATMLYGGQKLAASGKINFESPKPWLDLFFNGASFDLAALSNNSPVLGAASFQAIVKGSPDNLEFSGNFAIPAGTFSSNAFTDAAGLFSYAKNILTLKAVSLGSLGGKLTLSGTWDQKTGLFEQDITGKNLDAAYLSGGAVAGAVDMQVRASGKDAADAKVQGNFAMPTAIINGLTLENISGSIIKIGQSLEFADLIFSTAGQPMTAAGKILLGAEETELDMRVRSDGIDIASIKPDAPLSGQMTFQATVTGSVKNHTIAGSLQIPSGQFGSLPFGDMDGEFNFADDVLTLQNLQFGLFDGSNTLQKMTAAGKVLLSGNDPGLDFSVSSGGIEIASIKPDFPISGKLAFQALVGGTAKTPAITGSFQIPYGQINAVPFTDANGDFIFAADVLNLQSVRLNILGGSVTTEGTIANTGAYLQKVSGQNLDTALLTDGDIRGNASFTATVNGEGEWAKALVEGNIAIKSGTIKNTGFSSLNLEFRKRGEQVEIPTLNIKFLHGLVKGTGYTEGDYLVMKLSPGKNRRSRLMGIGTLLLFGTNPLAAILGQTLYEQFPLGVMRIRINGLKAQ